MIDVIIPTFRRPEALVCALRSVFIQAQADTLLNKIIVVDNSPEQSAKQIVSQLGAEAPRPIIYLHAPTPGVATARNVGMTATTSPYVAFLDDDQCAAADWLSRLYQTHCRFGADVTIGPILGRAPTADPSMRPYLETFFSRQGPAESCVVTYVRGCGHSLMTRASLPSDTATFDVSTDRTGGEDDVLFADLALQGAVFAWAADAVVEETASPQRSKVAYMLSRAVSFGQSPARTAFRERRWAAVVFWMAVGAGQLALYGGSAAGLWVLRRNAWVVMADRAVRGLGKIIWFVTLNFYGEAPAKARP